MPARSNPFQRLVRAIQGHISRSGTVTESRFLEDKVTGSPVEVDIVLEDTMGGHTVLIGIECTAEKRKATIEWYREMRAKHADLPISKTVLVSKAGFTKEVLLKAKKDDIEALTLDEATTFKWEALFSKIRNGTLADVRFHLRHVSATFANPGFELNSSDINPHTLVRFADFEISLGNLAVSAAAQGQLTKQIMLRLTEVLKKTDHFSFEFGVPDGTTLAIRDQQVPLFKVEATMVIVPRFQKLNLRPMEFAGETVATDSFPSDFLFPGAAGESLLTISENKDQVMRVSILGPSDGDIELEVFPSALYESPQSNESQ